eukprot:SAG31_NODE_535_length_14348_cov_11.339603_14_plen_68_part_00
MSAREDGVRAPIGGILADEMGLGKTAMTLALIVKDLEERQASAAAPVGPTLIVCPTSVLENWENEIW